MAQQDYNDWFDSEFTVGTTKEQREAVNMYGYDAVFDEKGNARQEIGQSVSVQPAQAVLTASEGLRNYKAARATTMQGYIELVNRLKQMNHAYYQGEPMVTDEEWEGLKLQAMAIEDLHPEWALADSPTRVIGDDTINGLRRVAHRTPMLSLQKADGRTEQLRHERLRSWYEKTAEGLDIVMEWKYDGNSVSLIYQDGKLIEASTRGKNGKEGSDITAQMALLPSIPNEIAATGRIEVRGEVYIPTSRYNALPEWEKAQTQQAQITSSLRQVREPELAAKQGFEFRVWEVIGNGSSTTDERPASDVSPYSPFHSDRIEWAVEQGFLPVTIHNVKTLDDIERLITQMEQEHDNEDFPTDGIVIKLDHDDDRNLEGTTAHHPKWAMAWKYAAKTAEVVITAISATRTGKPRLHFAPVTLNGSTFEQVDIRSGELQEYPFAIGDTVRIILKPGSSAIQFAGFAGMGDDNSNEESHKPSVRIGSATAEPVSDHALADRTSVKDFFDSHKWLRRCGMLVAGVAAMGFLYETGLLIPLGLVGLSVNGMIK